MKLKMFFAVLMMSTFLFGCDNKDEDPIPVDPNPPIPYNADMKGISEVPPNQSMATGYANFFLNQYTKVLTGTVHFTGMTPTAGHIHIAPADSAGPVVFPLTGSFNNNQVMFTSPALDSNQLAKLNAGLYYVNLHSTAFPAGEIRGQIIRQP